MNLAACCASSCKSADRAPTQPTCHTYKCHTYKTPQQSREAQGRGGAEYLLRERPQMSLYEVTVEREP